MKRLLLILLLIIIISSCISSKSVQIIKLGPRDMVEQLKLGEIDAFVAWEPFVSEAVVKGYGRILVTSSEIWPNHPCCVVATRKGLDKDTLTAFVWAHIKATRFINENKNSDEILTYSTEFTGMDKEVVKEALKRIKFVEFPEINEFKFYFNKLKESGYLTHKVTDLGYPNEEYFFKDFINEEIYKHVAKKLRTNSSWKPRSVNSTLRVGYLTADLHQLAFYVALKRGYFDEVGLRIIKKEYPNGVYEMEGFKLGEIDIGYLGSAPATLKRVNDNVSIRIIAGVNNEGSAIVVKEGISTISELAGKKVAIPGFGTVQDFLLKLAMEKLR